MADNRPGSIFSEKALESITASRQTDFLATIINTWMWFLLTSLSVVSAAFLYWGFFGVLVDSVPGFGVAVYRGGVEAIVARGEGLVETFNVSPGSVISRNHVIGQLYSSDFFFRVAKLETEYEYLKEYANQIRQGTTELQRHSANASDQKRVEFEKLQELLQKSRERSRELSALYNSARGSMAIPKIEYYRALDQALQVETNLSGIVQQIIDSFFIRQDRDWQSTQVHLSTMRELRVKEQELEQVLKTFRESMWLRSNSDGTVIEVLKSQGEKVSLGEAVALVSTNRFNMLRVVAFVPMEHGKKIRPGMSVFFAPSSFNPREYGYIRGVVAEISPFAASAASIASELKNPDLARLASQKSLQVRITVELLPDRSSASGFKWTSTIGAPQRLEAGASGQITITTRHRAPYTYVVPYVREKFLGIGKQPVLQEGNEGGQ